MKRMQQTRMVCLAALLLATAWSAVADPLAEYPFNGDAADTSGNGRHGTAVGGVTFTSTMGEFDGQGGYVRILDGDGGLSGMGALTLEVCFQADSWPSWPGDNGSAGLVSKMNNGDGYWGSDTFQLAIYREDDRHHVEAILYGGAATVESNRVGLVADLEGSFPQFDPRAWHNAAVIYDGQTARLMFDGVEVSSAPFAKALNSTPAVPLQLGRTYGSSVHNLPFEGRLDRVTVSSSAAPAPIASYHFNGNADDLSGQARHGQPSVGATFTSVTAEFGGENGQQDHIDVADDGGLSGMAQLAVRMRFQADTWPGALRQAGLVSKMNNGDGAWGSDCYLVSIYQDSGRYHIESVLYGEGDRIGLDADLSDHFDDFDPTAWHDVELVYDGRTVRLVFDGIEVDAGAFDKVLNANDDVPLRLGHIFGSSVHNGYFDGRMDYVEVFNVPEPATLCVLAMGGAASLVFRRRRR